LLLYFWLYLSLVRLLSSYSLKSWA